MKGCGRKRADDGVLTESNRAVVTRGGCERSALNVDADLQQGEQEAHPLHCGAPLAGRGQSWLALLYRGATVSGRTKEHEASAAVPSSYDSERPNLLFVVWYLQPLPRAVGLSVLRMAGKTIRRVLLAGTSIGTVLLTGRNFRKMIRRV